MRRGSVNVPKLATLPEQELAGLRAKLADVTAERDRLRDALEKYSAHLPSCSRNVHGLRVVCTCGRDSALVEKKEEKC